MSAESAAPPIRIGTPPPGTNLYGKVVCNCGWSYLLTEQDTVESVQLIIDAHAHIDGSVCTHGDHFCEECEA